MYGLISLQMHTYFTTYPKDSTTLKILVHSLGPLAMRHHFADFGAFDSQVAVLWCNFNYLEDIVLI